MKRIFSMCLCVWAMAASAYAQHMTFSGLPLTGHIDAFSRVLRDQGFQLQKRVASDNYYIYKGVFVGHTSYFQVNYTPNSHTVYQVRVTPRHVNTLVYRDSVASVYGENYDASAQGYRWVAEEGMVMLAVPEDKDPVLIIMDLEGARINKRERE